MSAMTLSSNPFRWCLQNGMMRDLSVLRWQGESQAIQWIKELKIEHAVQLNPPLSHAQMARCFSRRADRRFASIHDGTPNSLLEGMACGCFPVAGDLESIREWITHGQNGLLVDPNDPQSIADGDPARHGKRRPAT